MFVLGNTKWPCFLRRRRQPHSDSFSRELLKLSLKKKKLQELCSAARESTSRPPAPSPAQCSAAAGVAPGRTHRSEAARPGSAPRRHSPSTSSRGSSSDPWSLSGPAFTPSPTAPAEAGCPRGGQAGAAPRRAEAGGAPCPQRERRRGDNEGGGRRRGRNFAPLGRREPPGPLSGCSAPRFRRGSRHR